MQFSRKTIAIIALVIILAASNVAFAVLYMTKNVNITGGVSAVGAIEIYQEDGVTPLTSYDFPLFTGGTAGPQYLDFFVNNTGNQPVYVTWNISASSISWEIALDGHRHWENSVIKYWCQLYREEIPGSYWYPYTTGTPQETVFLAVGAGIKIRLWLTYTGQPATAETFSLVISFYAKDSTG